MSIVTSVLTKGTTMPINFDLIKSYLREDLQKTNQEIQLMIFAATSWAQSYIGKSILKHTRRVVFDKQHLSSPFTLPYSPILNIIEVKTVDLDGKTTIIDPSEYTLTEDILYYPNTISVTGFNNTINYTERSLNNYRLIIDYEVGYVDVRSIDESIKLAILKKVASDYYLKENIVEGSFTELNQAEKLLEEHKTVILI